MGKKIGIATGLMLAVVIVAAGVVAAQGVDTRPPWENEDGIWDMSKLPATESVVDSTGTVVGTVETRFYEEDVYPLPVNGPDGQLVGHLGENGFWALGEPEPVIEGAYGTVKGYDENGELVSKQTIINGVTTTDFLVEFDEDGEPVRRHTTINGVTTTEFLRTDD